MGGPRIVKQWELDEIMNPVKAVGNYTWDIDTSDMYADIVAIHGAKLSRYWVAQNVAYEDANFIVHALQDIPRLVARIKELEGYDD